MNISKKNRNNELKNELKKITGSISFLMKITAVTMASISVLLSDNMGAQEPKNHETTNIGIAQKTKSLFVDKDKNYTKLSKVIAITVGVPTTAFIAYKIADMLKEKNPKKSLEKARENFKNSRDKTEAIANANAAYLNLERFVEDKKSFRLRGKYKYKIEKLIEDIKKCKDENFENEKNKKPGGFEEQFNAIMTEFENAFNLEGDIVFEGMDKLKPEIQDVIRKKLGELFEKFPMVKEHLENREYQPSKKWGKKKYKFKLKIKRLKNSVGDGFNGESRRNSTAIIVDEYRYSENLNIAATDGWNSFYCGFDVERVLCHEFGHLIFSCIFEKNKKYCEEKTARLKNNENAIKKLSKINEKFVTFKSDGMMTKIKEEIMEIAKTQFNCKSDHISDYGNFKDPREKDANIDINEWLAEVVANSLTSNPDSTFYDRIRDKNKKYLTPLGEAINVWFENRLPEYLNGSVIEELLEKG